MSRVSLGTKRSFLNSLRRPGLISPSTFTNSVKDRSGGAQSDTTCRKTVSVTSSIGASTKNGRVKLCKTICLIILYIIQPVAMSMSRWVLLPAKNAEGDSIDDNEPDGQQTKLGADIEQGFALGGQLPQAVNNWGERQIGGDILQPHRH